MAQASIADELLAEASAPDSSLLQFYESSLTQLNNIYLKDVEFSVLYDIALYLNGYGRMSRDLEWMSFINDLGIVQNRAVLHIKSKSELKGVMPIYLALIGPLYQRCTFGHVIGVIMKNQRYDVLLQIKPDVERILNECKSFPCIQRNPTAPDAKECEKEDCIGENYFSKNLNENFQGNCPSYVITDSREKNLNKISSVLIKTETITILILHSEEDLNIAEELRSRLNYVGFRAKNLSDLDHLLMMNDFDVIPALISAVDFVVPIVSGSFLTQIHAGNHKPVKSAFDDIDYEDYCLNDSNNHYIYKLLLNELKQNRCLNFRVRSVMVPNFHRKHLKFDLLLTNSYKLWEKLPNFIKMLKKTKQLLERITE